MEEKITKIMVEFNLFGECIDFEKVAFSLNIEPTEIRKKQECKILEYAKDSWTLSTGYKETMAIAVPFEYLISLLEEKIVIINDLKKHYKLNSNLVIVVKADIIKMPEFVITNRCINFASMTNSEIHFDNYIYNDEEKN